MYAINELHNSGVDKRLSNFFLIVANKIIYEINYKFLRNLLRNLQLLFSPFSVYYNFM